MEIKKILNKEMLVEFNLTLYELFKNTKGFLIVQETEKSYDLTFKLPLPKDRMYIKGVEEILDNIVKFKGK